MPIGSNNDVLLSPSLSQRAKNLLRQVWSGCMSLEGSPSELWKTYLLKFLDSYAYFSFSIIFTLFLSRDFGYSDIEAGSIYGGWGALITIYGLATGFVVDNLGVATSVRLGFALSFVSRSFILVTKSRTMLLWNVFFLLPLSNCLGIPVLTIGIRRYTNAANRGFAFGLFYVVMNVAALVSGPVVDLCTKLYKDQEEGVEVKDSTQEEWSLTGYRLVILTGVVANVFALLVALTVREIKLVSPPVETISSMDYSESSAGVERKQGTAALEKDPPPKDANNNNVSTFTPLRGSAWSILKETIQAKSFWRYLAVILITMNVRMIFRHLDATLPKYMIREFGENVAYGSIYSINPALIIVLVPLTTAATSHIDPLQMIHYGTYISAISVFFLTVSTSVTACILFVTVLSIGEATWSPRLYDYTMSICPEGREGTYTALSSAPLFLAKLPVGLMSGYLLQKYCPEEGPRHSKLMWLIIGLTTATSPLLMTFCWKFVSYKDRHSLGHHKDSDGDFGGSSSGDIRYTELSTKAPSSAPYEGAGQALKDSEDERCIS